MQVYRGIVLDDKKLVANYEEGATIITTTTVFFSYTMIRLKLTLKVLHHIFVFNRLFQQHNTYRHRKIQIKANRRSL